ncbi:MAG TPA: aminotransferase class I/II-fold pyridoxal phosphate-dependent enzyme [Bacteroidales bacterium]|nr:aminotransferase class I/II-fold pyridoxal phosphate-dependent enzyme [Bacteroidales bacterium]
MNSKKLRFDSKLIHSASIEDKYLSANVPIYQTSTFRFYSADHGSACFLGEEEGYIYTRIGNPTIEALEQLVADLENGYKGIATSSGMAAVNTVYLTYLDKGSHIVSHNAIYGPARGVIENIYSKYGVEYSYVNASNIQEVKNAIKENTRLIYIETPANPTMDICDIAAIAQVAHEHSIPLCVDNTFCSPYLQKPLELGADISLHSMTKFINGHADIVAGMIVTKKEEEYKKMRNVMINMGFNMDPHQAYMVIRGLKTLSLRIERAQENAMKLAEFLENHPKIEWVKYPGLKSHPHYELAKKQMSGFGSMISFEMKGGYQAGKILMDNVKMILLAVSLGGVESLIQHPASMTHSKISPEKRMLAGISDGLVRFSVGIEDYYDLLEDISQALDKC